METFLIVGYNNSLGENSICWLYSSINKLIDKTKLILFKELEKFVYDYLQSGNGIFPEIKIFLPSKVLKLSFMDGEIFSNEIAINSIKNPYYSAIHYYNLNFKSKPISTCKNKKKHLKNLKREFKRFKENKIKSVDFYEILNNWIHSHSIDELNLIDLKSKNNGEIESFEFIYNRIAFFEYLFYDGDLNITINSIVRSISLSRGNSIILLNNLNLLRTIDVELNPNPNLGINKLILRIIRNIEIETLTDNELKNYLSILYSAFRVSKPNSTNTINLNKIKSDKFDYELEILKGKFYQSFKLIEPKVKIYNSINEIYKEFTENLLDYEIENFNEIQDLIILENLILIFKRYLFKSNMNPDNLVNNIKLSKYIKEKKYEAGNKYKNNPYEPWLEKIIIKGFNEIVNFSNILYSHSDPNEIVRKSIRLFDTLTYSTFELTHLIPRLLLFCTQNYNKINHDVILDVINYQDETEEQYITTKTIMKSLLMCLIFSKSLNVQEIHFLNGYLGKDIKDYTQESIYELNLSIIKLENHPKLIVDQSYQTNFEINSETSDLSELNQKSFYQFSQINLIPEELVNLFVKDQDLINYIKLFYSFQVLKTSWRKYNDIELPFQKLQNLKTYMRSLNIYNAAIRQLKLDNSQIVDDITIDFLEVEMLISDEPDFALGKLPSIKQKLDSFTPSKEEWIQYYKLIDNCFETLNLKKTDQYQKLIQEKAMILNNS